MTTAPDRRGWMSGYVDDLQGGPCYDFTVLIPELIGTRHQAMTPHDAMCRHPDPDIPDEVQRFINDLNAKHGCENDPDTTFLSVAPLDGDTRGAVVPTSALSLTENRAAMLELTRDHGLGLYDPRRDRLYDPEVTSESLSNLARAPSFPTSARPFWQNFSTTPTAPNPG